MCNLLKERKIKYLRKLVCDEVLLLITTFCDLMFYAKSLDLKLLMLFFCFVLTAPFSALQSSGVM